MITIVLVFILSFLLPTGLQAQQKDDLLFRRFEVHFGLLDSLIFMAHEPASAVGVVAIETPLQEVGMSAVDSLIDAKVEEQQRALKAETGLLLSGHAYYRTGQGIGVDPDENDALAAYAAKAQVELRWNIMSSSLIGRKGRLNELNLHGQLEHASIEKERVRLAIERQKECFRIEYDSLLSSILQLRISNLQLLNDAQAYLASDRSIGTDELLKIMDEQAIAERLLTSIPKDYPVAAQLMKPQGEVVSLDTARLKSHIREHALELQASDLQIELLQQKEKNTTYWSAMGLSPFVRYSYYVRPEVKNPSNVDAGIAFQLPLSMQESRKRKALSAERLQVTAEKEEMMLQLMEEVENILLDIERANRGLAGELKRIGVMREYMQLRRENYQGHIGEYNFMSRIKEYNHYLTCWENYYSYQYKRDCCIAELQSFLYQQSVLDFCIVNK